MFLLQIKTNTHQKTIMTVKLAQIDNFVATALRSLVSLTMSTLHLSRLFHFYRAALNAGRSSQEKSVCPSVCETRGLWQNGRKISADFLYRAVCLNLCKEYKLSDKQSTSLIPDKELNISMYGTPLDVIIYRSYRKMVTLKNGAFLADPVYWKKGWA